MKGEYPERPVVSVGAVIIQDSCALVVKRGTNPGKGVWSVPGGKVELGETLPQAVAREAREETGVIVEPGKVLNVSDAIFRDEHGRIQFHYVFVDFWCRPLEGELRAAGDVTEVRWISRAELRSLPITPTAEQVLQKAFDGEQVGD